MALTQASPKAKETALAAFLKVAQEIRDRSNQIVAGVTGTRAWLRAQADALDKAAKDFKDCETEGLRRKAMDAQEMELVTKLMLGIQQAQRDIAALRKDCEKAFKAAAMPFVVKDSRVAPEDRPGPTPGSPRQAELDDETLVALHEAGELEPEILGS